MRCDFSIELVILCATVSIHAILRPTSSDVARRRIAIAPGAKNLRIACDGERILRAHNSVQTGISWLWVYADMHVYCVAHKTRWQISNFTLKKTKSFWSWCGRENICLIYHNLVIEISVEVTHGKILSNWHSKILFKYSWNFVSWSLNSLTQWLYEPSVPLFIKIWCTLNLFLHFLFSLFRYTTKI